MQEIKVGVLGAGYITRRMYGPQLRRLGRLFEFAGVCDLLEEKAREVSHAFGPRVYPDFDRMLDDPSLELIIVASKPDSTHAEPAIRGLDAGKHVLVDKAMAASSRECDRMTAGAGGIWKPVTLMFVEFSHFPRPQCGELTGRQGISCNSSSARRAAGNENGLLSGISGL